MEQPAMQIRLTQKGSCVRINLLFSCSYSDMKGDWPQAGGCYRVGWTRVSPGMNRVSALFSGMNRGRGGGHCQKCQNCQKSPKLENRNSPLINTDDTDRESSISTTETRRHGEDQGRLPFAAGEFRMCGSLVAVSSQYSAISQ